MKKRYMAIISCLTFVLVIALMLGSQIKPQVLVYFVRLTSKFRGNVGVVQRDRKRFPLSKSILVTAHRGYSGMYPENTKIAFEKAIQEKPHFLELDLVMTKDAVLILRHENQLGLTTDVATKFPQRKKTKMVSGKKKTGWFSEDFTLAEIRTLKTKERFSFRSKRHDGKYGIMTFEEFLAFLQETNTSRTQPIKALIEIKSATHFREQGLPMEEKIAALLKKYGHQGKNAQVVLQSFEVTPLKHLRKLTTVPIFQLFAPPSWKPYDLVKQGKNITYYQMTNKAELEKVKLYADGIVLSKFLVYYELYKQKKSNKTFLELAKKMGFHIQIYTFRDEARMRAGYAFGPPENEYFLFFYLGVDGVIVDSPPTAWKAIRAWEKRKKSKKK